MEVIPRLSNRLFFKSLINPILHFHHSPIPASNFLPINPNPIKITHFLHTTRTLNSSPSSSRLTSRAGWLLGLGEKKQQKLPDLVKAGDPVLHEAARIVDPKEIGSEKIQKIIDDMIDVMRKAPGVGLAAPQIGIPLKVNSLLFFFSYF